MFIGGARWGTHGPPAVPHASVAEEQMKLATYKRATKRRYPPPAAWAHEKTRHAGWRGERAREFRGPRPPQAGPVYRPAVRGEGAGPAMGDAFERILPS